MKRNAITILVLLLAWCTLASGAELRRSSPPAAPAILVDEPGNSRVEAIEAAAAKITGPTSVARDGLAIHKLTGKWSRITWNVKGVATRIADPGTPIVYEDGATVVWNGPPGVYEVSVVAGNANPFNLAHKSMMVTITGAPTPPPPPPPDPPPPDPPPPTPSDIYAQAQAKATAAMAGLPATAKADAALLADIYEAVASRGSEITSTDQLIRVTHGAKVERLGTARADAWAPWATEVGLWLDAQKTAGTLSSMAQWLKAWQSIAAGLRGGK